mgnify:CR=1 FL=1
MCNAVREWEEEIAQKNLAKGTDQEKIRFLKALIRSGVESDEFLAKTAELSVEEVKKVRRSM